MFKYINIIILVLFGHIVYVQFPEGFEGETFPPDGWITFNNEVGVNYDWTTSNEAFSGSAAAFVRWENVDEGIAEDWLVSPRFMPTENAHLLSFYQKDSYPVNYASEYFVRVSTGLQDDPVDFVDVDHQYETDMRLTYTYHEVDLSNFIGQEIYVAFVMTNDDGDNWVIDNINMSNCALPDGLYVDNTTNTGADLYWEAEGTDSWEIEVVPYGDVPSGDPAYKNISQIPFTWEGGEQFMRYSFYVRSVCEDGSVSNYSQPVDFLTSCGNTSCDYIFVLEDAYGDDWNGASIEIRQNGLTLGTITQEERGFGPYYFNFSLCDEYPFELVWNSGNWDQECIFSLYDIYNQQFYHFAAGDAPEDEETFFTYEADCDPVTCRFPGDLKTMDYAQNGAVIDWEEKDGAVLWDLEFVPFGTEPTGIPTIENNAQKPYKWAGGEPGTYYEIYVRAVCDADDRSKWSLPTTFSTLCDAVYSSYPYEEDFVSEFELPYCWIRQHMGKGSYSWETVADTYTNDTLVYCAHDNKDQDEWLVAPAFNFSSAVDKVTLEFDWKMSYYWMVYPYDKGDLLLRVSTDRGNTWSAPVWSESDEPLFGSFEWQNSIIDLSEYLGETEIWLAFQYLANDASTVYLDNFVVRDGNETITSSENMIDSEPELRLFPNPADEYLIIHGLNHDVSQISILDVSGQVVQSINWQMMKDEKIDISMINPGIYFCTIAYSDRTETRKFVKL